MGSLLWGRVARISGPKAGRSGGPYGTLETMFASLQFAHLLIKEGAPGAGCYIGTSAFSAARREVHSEYGVARVNGLAGYGTRLVVEGFSAWGPRTGRTRAARARASSGAERAYRSAGSRPRACCRAIGLGKGS